MNQGFTGALPTMRAGIRRPVQREGEANSTRATTLLRVLMFATVAIVFGRLHDLFGATQRLPVGKLLLPLAMGALLLQPRLQSRLRVLRSPQAKFFFLFVAAIALSVPFSLYKGGSFQTFVEFLKGSLPLVLILALGAASERDLSFVVRSVVATTALLGIALLAGLGESEQGRMSLGATYDANDIALVGVIALPFCVWLAAQARGWDRILGVTGAASTLALVITAASRGGMLALAAVLLTLFLHYRKHLSVGAKMLAVGMLVLSLSLAPDTFWQRFDTLLNPTEDYNASDELGRKALWIRGLGYFARDPLTGVGISQFGTAEGAWAIATRGSSDGFKWSTAHSVWIQVLVELGILGIVGFVGIFLPTFRDAGRLRRLARGPVPPTERLTSLGNALTASIVGFMVGGTFLSMAYSPPAMLLAAVSIAFAGIARQAQRRARLIHLDRLNSQSVGSTR